MSNKTFKIWRVLMDAPNEWIDMSDLAFKVDMTQRQVLSVMQGMADDRIEVCKDPKAVKLNIADDHDLHLLRRGVLMDHYGMDESQIDVVMNAVPPIGWMSVMDLSKDTGMSHTRVSIALSCIEDVDQMSVGSTRLYTRKGDARCIQI